MWRSLARIVAGVLSRNLTSNAMPNRIKTFVFLDLETTGLPHMEHNMTKITEMCAIAVQADHIELGCFPRVHNKLSFCFNPNKLIHPASTDITGLSNELLEHQASFSSDTVEVLSKWLEMSSKPICFVAHNGNKFDYPILKAEIKKSAGCCLDAEILCVDSLGAFRELDVSQNAVKEEVPFEFDDDFDELLCQVVEEAENEQKLTPEEVQKINETTPKKQVISSETPSCSRSVKRNFNRKKPFTSYKLQDVYTRLTSKPAVNAHEAEGDVIMMITCAAFYGERFVAFANENAAKFSEIPAMTPGRKIGT